MQKTAVVNDICSTSTNLASRRIRKLARYFQNPAPPAVHISASQSVSAPRIYIYVDARKAALKPALARPRVPKIESGVGIAKMKPSLRAEPA